VEVPAPWSVLPVAFGELRAADVPYIEPGFLTILNHLPEAVAE
jgi:hypothetical protein